MGKSKYIGRYEEYGDPDNTKKRYILDTVTGNVYLANKGKWELKISFDKDNLNDENKPKDHWKQFQKPKDD